MELWWDADSFHSLPGPYFVFFNKSGFLLAPPEMMFFVSYQMVHVFFKTLRALFPWATGCPERLIQWRSLFPFPASVFLRLCILDSHLPLLPWIQGRDDNSLDKIIHNGGKASTFQVKSDFSGSLERRAHPSPATERTRRPGEVGTCWLHFTLPQEDTVNVPVASHHCSDPSSRAFLAALCKWS